MKMDWIGYTERAQLCVLDEIIFGNQSLIRVRSIKFLI